MQPERTTRAQREREASLARRYPLLTQPQKELMFALTLRDPVLLRYAVNEVQRWHFTERDQYLLAVWQQVASHYAEFEQPIPRKTLYTELKAVLDSEQLDLTGADIRTLEAFLKMAYRLSEQELADNAHTAQQYLRRFLSEALQTQVRERLGSEGAVQLLPELLDDMAGQARRYDAAGVTGAPLPFDGMRRANDLRLDKTSSGIGFLDIFLNGGQANGEVYGFCAPYGVCKTLLACQLAVHRVQLELEPLGEPPDINDKEAYAAYAAKASRTKRVYLITFEEPRKSIQTRLLACAGRIDKDVVESGDNSKFSSTLHRNFKPYEMGIIKAAIAAGRKPPGEINRYHDARRQLSFNLRHLDFTGAEPTYAGLAGELAQGIRTAIENDQRYNGFPGVSMVLIDYAGAAADRYLEARNLSAAENLRHILGKFPLRVKTNVAIPFNCPVWAFHQLGTGANSMSPGRAPKKTDTAEAKNYNENTDFGFAVGEKTNDGYAVFTCTKGRRAGSNHDCVIRIDGRLGRIEPAASYIVHNDKIVPKSTFAAVHEAEVPEAGKKRPPTDFGISDMYR